LAALCLFVVSPASAQSDGEKEMARTLMKKGDGLLESKDFAGALKAYQGADTIMRVPVTRVAIARALVALGRLVDAKRAAEQAAQMAPKPDEPNAFAEARRAGEELEKQLASRIPTLKIEARGVEGHRAVELRVDGEAFQPDDFAQAQEMDPGTHQVVLIGDANKASASVTLKEGERRTLTLKLGEEPAAKPAAEPKVTTPKTEPKKSSSGRRTLGWVSIGVGGAGLVAAGVTGVLILQKKAKVEDDCPNKRCNSDGRDAIDSSKPLLIGNAVAWGVGVVGLGVGTYLLLTSKDGSSETALGASPTSGGLVIGVRRSY
jgi:hypothetical protein